MIHDSTELNLAAGDSFTFFLGDIKLIARIRNINRADCGHDGCRDDATIHFAVLDAEDNEDTLKGLDFEEANEWIQKTDSLKPPKDW